MTRFSRTEIDQLASNLPGMPRVLHLARARDLPDPTPDGVPCCDGNGYMGPEYCTCWEPVYDLEQAAELRTDLVPEQAEQLCSTCAFRPGSPERRDHPDAVAGSEDLLAIVLDVGRTFWCHTGMRRSIGWRHPNGMEVLRPPSPDVEAFQPPILDGVPYQADGTPGLHCAGLAAARRAKSWTP